VCTFDSPTRGACVRPDRDSDITRSTRAPEGGEVVPDGVAWSVAGVEARLTLDTAKLGPLGPDVAVVVELGRERYLPATVYGFDTTKAAFDDRPMCARP
jgi:hypothetical protein